MSDVIQHQLLQALAMVQSRTRSLDSVPKPVSNVNFNSQQATNFRIENRTSDPASPSVGQIWLRTDL